MKCGDTNNPFQPFHATTEEEDIIIHYFNAGFNYTSILMFLQKFHHINISLSTLKRRLKKYGANKQQNVNDSVVRNIISQQIFGSPLSLLGYRSWWNLLKLKYGISIPRDRIMHILKELDPEATDQRRSRRLRRRQYSSPGTISYFMCKRALEQYFCFLAVLVISGWQCCTFRSKSLLARRWI